MFDFSGLSNAVIEGDSDQVQAKVNAAINAKVDPLAIINQGLIGGMNVVGQRFKVNDMFVPEVLMSARAMNDGIELVKPLLAGGEMTNRGTVIIGTVKGDLHDIGKSLVGMMLECSGFKVVDLGVDISPEEFIKAIKENDGKVLALSALLTTTMLSMKSTIDECVAQGMRNDVKVIIGGAPISQEFSDQIGADGYAGDAAAAVELVAKLLAS
ncbi:cobalamin B12-binding domain-containing protein [Desulfosporosinus meridiei]|uniref:Putative cobalamin binding protein n=1 Tax=Desulfosporosinus meridiei (strain ATCC BAA-275 / DSM 13257 / KCTC 12902 / NCIMB 13706 / S10) TaxID=768704 RepID=J7IQK2_DESMD|nr:corrinoid protein [Desulfosporosinus meridiei]AFQ44142.1 putative cobalamin binding protein [Desulfosporosinus meridiei DSM 13257]